MVQNYDYVSAFVKSLNSYLGYLKPAKHKNLVEDIKTKNPFLDNSILFQENKIKEKYSNKITDFKDQHLFFKGNQENTIVLLDVGCFYRILGDDAQPIARAFNYSLNKTKSYFFVNIPKSEVQNIIDQLLETKRAIVLTELVAEDRIKYRQIKNLYISI